tara:strand:+ start:2069 stop:2230 length:162 start_codon:yes stop_codon:yes gene_type:complete
MDKVITLTDAEYYALISYFDETSINISSMIKKKGLKQTRDFEAVLLKLYAVDK